jgi:O-antigen biosynthesis protein
VTVGLENHFIGLADKNAVEASRLRPEVPVSIVVGTYDRPDDLEECLQCLINQDTPRWVEIVVVDNNPSSGITPPTVAKFPNVRLINEPRKGVAFARNAGIIASQGEIIVTTDDDIIMSSKWLENLLAPLARADVMMVTSNYMPPEVETQAQHLFAKYDGMGRGHERFEVSGDWFDSFRRRPVPTWILGGTGNAAYRASIFKDPKIGLMKETLGPGMPTGVGEDSYLFYKVLKAGHTIVYEPSAFVWHKYRREMTALYRQIYNYSKGHIAHHLTTIIHDQDFRGLVQIGYVLPMWRIRQLSMWIRGKSDYPLKFIWMEIKGNFVGPWALWQSYRRVKREGISRFDSQPQEQALDVPSLRKTNTLS